MIAGKKGEPGEGGGGGGGEKEEGNKKEEANKKAYPFILGSSHLSLLSLAR